MGTFTLTQKAKIDFKIIAAHTQRRWGKPQRMLYAKQFDDAFHMLADTPKAGNSCDFLKQGYRKFPNGSHVIFYRELGVSAGVKPRLFAAVLGCRAHIVCVARNLSCDFYAGTGLVQRTCAHLDTQN